MTKLKKLNLEFELNETIGAVGNVIYEAMIIEGGSITRSNAYSKLRELRAEFAEILYKRQNINIARLTEITSHNVKVEIEVAKSVIGFIDNSLKHLESL
jgi:hypothetical protein